MKRKNKKDSLLTDTATPLQDKDDTIGADCPELSESEALNDSANSHLSTENASASPHKSRAMKPRLLTTVDSFAESNMIAAFMKDEGINVLVKELGLGGFMKVTMGFTVFGRELYVDEDDFERASELLKAFFDTDAEGDEGIKKHPFGIF